MLKPSRIADFYARRRAREEELEALRREPGERGVINCMVWGRNDAEFLAIAEAEHRAERAAKPWGFVDRFRGGGKKVKD